MTNSKPTASVKVVGVGSAGLRLLDKLAAVGFPAGQFIALDFFVLNRFGKQPWTLGWRFI